MKAEDAKTCPCCGGTGEKDEGPCSPPIICDCCNGIGRVPLDFEPKVAAALQKARQEVAHIIEAERGG